MANPTDQAQGRSRQVCFRTDDKTMSMIQDAATKAHQSNAEFCRAAVYERLRERGYPQGYSGRKDDSDV